MRKPSFNGVIAAARPTGRALRLRSRHLLVGFAVAIAVLDVLILALAR
ncbi:MAG TPA: hypothetical protein VGM83_09305 [Devosiaceae bacterium]|jgi:hypothetical protein